MPKQTFKDACDECGKFDYCKGVDGKVLCPECAAHEEEKNHGNQD